MFVRASESAPVEGGCMSTHFHMASMARMASSRLSRKRDLFASTGSIVVCDRLWDLGVHLHLRRTVAICAR